MCMSKGIPKKPEYGPCRESHGVGLGSVGASYLYNGTGSGYYWANSTTAAGSSANNTTTATFTAAGWTTV